MASWTASWMCGVPRNGRPVTLLPRTMLRSTISLKTRRSGIAVRASRRFAPVAFVPRSRAASLRLPDSSEFPMSLGEWQRGRNCPRRLRADPRPVQVKAGEVFAQAVCVVARRLLRARSVKECAAGVGQRAGLPADFQDALELQPVEQIQLLQLL